MSINQSNNSICFNTFDGKVASIEFTPNGSFLIVVFYSGLVKVFDLELETDNNNRNSLISNSLDDDDRQGVLLTRLRSTAAMVFSTPALSKLVGNVTQENGSHIFIGMKTSCTCLAILDVASIRLSKIKNGFLSSIDDGIKLFYYYDSRIKGLIDVSTLSFRYLTEDEDFVDLTNSTSNANIAISSNNTTVASSSSISFLSNLDFRDYSCRYRMITGACLSSVNVWDVEITTRYNKQTGEPTYSDEWIFLTTFNTNGISLNFGSISNHYSHLNYFYQSDLPDSLVTINQYGTNYNFNSISEIFNCSNEKDVKSNLISSSGEPISKPVVLKDSSTFFTTSLNGLLIFGGKSEFIVYHYHSNYLSNEDLGKGIVYREVYSLNDFGVEGGKVGKNNIQRRGGRHLRQIESIHPTNDGNFALIICSDNSILLYSTRDYYGYGVNSNQIYGKPSSIISSIYPSYNANDSYESGISKGALYQLFQASDKYKLNANIFYIKNEKVSCSEKLMISITWTLIGSPYEQGVITSYALCLKHPNPAHLRNLIPSIASEYYPKIDTDFPVDVLTQNCNMNFSYNSNPNYCCEGCGSKKFVHWKTSITNKSSSISSSKFVSNSSSNNSTTSSQVKNSTSVKRNIKLREESDNEFVDSDIDKEQKKKQKIEEGPKIDAIKTDAPKINSSSASKDQISIEHSNNCKNNNTNNFNKINIKESLEYKSLSEKYLKLQEKYNTLEEKFTEMKSFYESALEQSKQNHESDLRDKQETIDHYVRKMQARQHRELQVRRDWKNDSEAKKLIIKDCEKKIESYEVLIKSLIEEDLGVVKFINNFNKKRSSLIKFLSLNELDNYSSRNNLYNLNIKNETEIQNNNDVPNIEQVSEKNNFNSNFETPLMPVLMTYLNNKEETRENDFYYNNITQNLLSNLVSTFDPPLTLSSSSSSSSNELSSSSSKFFCIICQDHTADTACSPCGHVCLCRHHQIQLEDQSKSSNKEMKCLVCQANVNSFLSIF